MPWAFDYDTLTVGRFVQQRLPGLALTERMRAIGLRRDGDLVAGVLYEGINDFNLWMHVAAVPGRRWLTRDYLRAVFGYPFLVCGVRRISAYVDASNADARRFDEGLGFREEARLRGAAADGGDLILYALWREECRYA
jgi:RimJ/RimL family protein N-acetyltransferase